MSTFINMLLVVFLGSVATAIVSSILMLQYWNEVEIIIVEGMEKFHIQRDAVWVLVNDAEVYPECVTFALRQHSWRKRLFIAVPLSVVEAIALVILASPDEHWFILGLVGAYFAFVTGIVGLATFIFLRFSVEMSMWLLLLLTYASYHSLYPAHAVYATTTQSIAGFGLLITFVFMRRFEKLQEREKVTNIETHDQVEPSGVVACS